jgi:hypothetical protein
VVTAWLAAAGTAEAQAPTCDPPCQSSELCSPDGLCVSKCNPLCSASEICSREGACISRCNPPCPAHEACTLAGECVSRCNPPCAVGERCTASGECELRAGATVTITGSQPRAGWARKAGVLGSVTTGVLDHRDRRGWH